MTAKYEQAMEAFAELEVAKEKFFDALSKFNAVYDPETVGIDTWYAGIDETMGEIEADIEDNLGE